MLFPGFAPQLLPQIPKFLIPNSSFLIVHTIFRRGGRSAAPFCSAK